MASFSSAKGILFEFASLNVFQCIWKEVLQVESSGIERQITIDKDQLCRVKQYGKNVTHS